jgi:integrase
MARPRKNKPQFRHGQYWGRHTIDVVGVTVRRWFPLGTDSLALASAKNEELRERLSRGEIPKETETRAPELVSGAFKRIVAKQREEGMKSWKDREQRLRDYALPVLGKLTISAVRAQHGREVLEHCVSTGKSKQTVTHLRNDLSSIFDALWRDDLIPENPLDKVRIPKIAKQDNRARQILTDEEFAQFVTCEAVSLRLRTMAMVSRTLGGLRTSDLHAWRWEHIDVSTWRTCQIRRPKTRGMAFLELPDLLRFWLRRWWVEVGSPTTGPVFSVGRGERSDEHRAHTGYARQLRAALIAAGVTRAELHEDGDFSKRVDFHSFRRAYTTALADLGLNVQTTMRLAGHSKVETHLGYVDRLRPMASPLGLLSPAPRQLLEANIANQQEMSGADGTRTRGLRRDRQARSVFLRLFAGAFDRGATKKEHSFTSLQSTPRQYETKLRGPFRVEVFR